MSYEWKWIVECPSGPEIISFALSYPCYLQKKIKPSDSEVCCFTLGSWVCNLLSTCNNELCNWAKHTWDGWLPKIKARANSPTIEEGVVSPRAATLHSWELLPWTQQNSLNSEKKMVKRNHTYDSSATNTYCFAPDLFLILLLHLPFSKDIVPVENSIFSTQS